MEEEKGKGVGELREVKESRRGKRGGMERRSERREKVEGSGARFSGSQY